MLCECNLLSRCNQYADELREKEAEEVLRRDQSIEARILKGHNPNTKLEAGTNVAVTLMSWVPKTQKLHPTFATIATDYLETAATYKMQAGFSHQQCNASAKR